jgi:hypothetical protein
MNKKEVESTNGTIVEASSSARESPTSPITATEAAVPVSASAHRIFLIVAPIYKKNLTHGFFVIP